MHSVSTITDGVDQHRIGKGTYVRLLKVAALRDVVMFTPLLRARVDVASSSPQGKKLQKKINGS